MAYDERPETKGEAQRAWDYFDKKWCQHGRYGIRRVFYEDGKWHAILSASCWMRDGKKVSATPEEVNA
jgi:hypothetical protein